jgi:DNA polymerase III subunit beta
MKLTIPAKGLERALSTVARAASRSGSIPITAAVLIDATEEGVITLSATDLDLSLQLRAQIEAERPGKVAVGARVLSDLVRQMGAGELQVETDEPGEDGKPAGEMRLAAGDNAYTLRTHDPGHFPRIPDLPPEGVFSVPARAFADAVAKTLPASSRDDTRAALTGVHMSFGEKTLELVATDSYRMGLAAMALGDARAEPKRALVPAKALGEAVKLCALSEGLAVAFTENAAFFKAGGVTLATRQIAADFPDHSKILPTAFSREFVLETNPLRESLRRVALFCARQNPPVPVTLAFKAGEGTLEGGTLTVACESRESGSATERMGCEVAEDFRAAFNIGYLMDGIKACASEKVRLRFNDPLKPAVIVPEASEAADERAGDASFTYLIMPMRDPEEGESGEPDSGKAKPPRSADSGAAQDTGADLDVGERFEADPDTGGEATSTEESECPETDDTSEDGPEDAEELSAKTEEVST